MIKRLTVFTLAIALASVANAAVVWNWTGTAGGGDGTTWEAAANWSTTDTTSYAYPSQQYEGDSSLYHYINDDVTAINITNGDTVNKIVDDTSGYTSSDFLYMGGDTSAYPAACCTLTVANNSTLYTGDDLRAGITGTHSVINVTSGANLSSDYAYFGYGGTCTVNITSGATVAPRNGTRLGWSGGTGYMTVDGGTYNPVTYSFRLGGGDGAYAQLDVRNSGVVDVTTDVRLADESGTSAKVTVDDSDFDVGTYLYVANNGTATMDVKNGSAVDITEDLRVGSESQGTMTVSGGSTVDVGDTIFVGRNSSGNGTLNVSGTGTVVRSLGTSTGSGYNRLAIGYSGKGVVNVTAGAKISIVDDIYVGDQSSGNGTLNVSGAGSLVEVTSDQMTIARNSSALGEVNVENGGAITIADDLYVALNDGTQAKLNVTGANSTVTVIGDDMIVCDDDNSSAELTVGNGALIDVQGDSLTMASGVGSTATLDVTGAMVQAAGRMYLGYGGSSSGGTATVNMTGGTMNVGTDLRMAHGATAKATLNVSGGGVVNVGRDFETSVDGDYTKAGAEGMEARIHLYDGEINVDGYLALACAGQGGCLAELIVDDGEVNVGLDPPEFDPPREFLDNLFMGWYDTDAQAYLTINGGTMTVAGAISMGAEYNYDGTPIATTGNNSGVLRITIDGGILQAEDYIDAGTISDHLITLTDGELRINGSAISEAEMADLVAMGDINCPNGYVIFSEGGYTVLTVPEPTTAGLVLLGLAAMIVVRRRRSN